MYYLYNCSLYYFILHIFIYYYYTHASITLYPSALCFYMFRIPLKTYCLLAFLTVGTMGISNASLGYLNYPTQVIFKCCKLIPVMFGGIFIQGNICYNHSCISISLVQLGYRIYRIERRRLLLFLTLFHID